MARPIVILLALLFLAVPIVAPCAADYRARTSTS
jgi:hypothetical protein